MIFIDLPAMKGYLPIKKPRVGDIYGYYRSNQTLDYVEYKILGVEGNEIYYELHISNSYDSPYSDLGNMSFKDFKKIIYKLKSKDS